MSEQKLEDRWIEDEARQAFDYLADEMLRKNTNERHGDSALRPACCALRNGVWMRYKLMRELLNGRSTADAP